MPVDILTGLHTCTRTGSQQASLQLKQDLFCSDEHALTVSGDGEWVDEFVAGRGGHVVYWKRAEAMIITTIYVPLFRSMYVCCS